MLVPEADFAQGVIQRERKKEEEKHKRKRVQEKKELRKATGTSRSTAIAMRCLRAPWTRWGSQTSYGKGVLSLFNKRPETVKAHKGKEKESLNPDRSAALSRDRRRVNNVFRARRWRFRRTRLLKNRTGLTGACKEQRFDKSYSASRKKGGRRGSR